MRGTAVLWMYTLSVHRKKIHDWSLIPSDTLINDKKLYKTQ